MLIISEDLTRRLSKMDEAEFRTYLFLEPHPVFPNQWLINSSDPTFPARMGRLVKDYRAVSPLAWQSFEQRAAEEGYKVVFLIDPTPTFNWVERLNATPTVTVNSTLKDTINGMFRFQVQGFNFAKDLLAAVLQHSTGTGKTVTASALNKHHEQEDNYDLCIWAVKAHNRTNTQRALKRNVDLDTIVIDGTKGKRYEQYAQAAKAMEEGRKVILVINYEKLRDDKDPFILLVTGRKLLIIWDEMPTKLRNRTIKLYRAVAEILYTSFMANSKGDIYYPSAGKLRPSELRQVMLSATPIENSPEDWFNCVRLLDPTIYGSVKKFHDTFVARFDYWGNVEKWHKLDLLGAKAAHITHQVDKNDPDIAVLFPKIREEQVVLDMHEDDRKLYDKLTDEYRKLRKKDASALKQDEVLAAIGVLQMLCNNPRAVLVSAEQRAEYLAELELDDDARKRGGEVALKLINLVKDESKFTDETKDGEPRCSKLARLQDDLASGEKTAIFTAYNSTNIPYIQRWLDKWGINYVVYSGSRTQMQAAEDRFREDANVQVFLSSDRGSDSINLEMATLTINYDLPWKWSTLTQRQNRIHRITSAHARVRFLTYTTANTVEDRRKEIVDTKRGYHEAVLKGEIAEQSLTLRSSDYLYILTGEREAE